MKNQLLKSTILVLLTTLILVSCNNTKKEKVENQENNNEIIIKEKLNKIFVGNWIALSNVYMTTLGNLKIRPNEFSFSLKDETKFEIVKQNNEECIVKLDKIIDVGNFMRIGPISSEEADYYKMEVAFYETKEKAMTKRENRTDNAVVWGIYIQYKNSKDYCFRNEYPHSDNSGMKDILELEISINGNFTSGFYNWLPAEKDQRRGQISGKFENNITKGIYTFSQEGISKTENIEIILNDNEALIKGDKKGLGLDAKIQKVKCTDEKE